MTLYSEEISLENCVRGFCSYIRVLIARLFLFFFFSFFIYLHRVHDRHLYTTSTISPVSTEIAATTTFFPYHPLVFHKQSKLNPALIGSV